MAHRWYKSAAIVISILIGVFLIVFMILIAYYAWQIKYGGAQTLAQEFKSASFTNVPISNANQQIATDTRPAIRPEDPTRGTLHAPITIVAFIDFECPFCQQGYSIFQRVMAKYAPASLVVFKNFPITVIHPNSNAAALATACAGEQGHFWDYYDLLFQNKKLDRASLGADADTLHLNAAQFASCLDSQKFQQTIDNDLKDGVDIGVRGTPTYFVNGIKIEGVADEKTWDAVILKALKEQKI